MFACSDNSPLLTILTPMQRFLPDTSFLKPDQGKKKLNTLDRVKAGGRGLLCILPLVRTSWFWLRFGRSSVRPMNEGKTKEERPPPPPERRLNALLALCDFLSPLRPPSPPLARSAFRGAALLVSMGCRCLWRILKHFG